MTVCTLLISRSSIEVRRIVNHCESYLNHLGIPNYWLCCAEFTIADIGLGVLLHRLYCLGLENLFWANDKRPLIGKYYVRLSERDSFKRSLPNTLSTIKTVWSKTPSIYKFGVGSLSAAILLTSIIAHRIWSRYKLHILETIRYATIEIKVLNKKTEWFLFCDFLSWTLFTKSSVYFNDRTKQSPNLFQNAFQYFIIAQLFVKPFFKNIFVNCLSNYLLKLFILV